MGDHALRLTKAFYGKGSTLSLAQKSLRLNGRPTRAPLDSLGEKRISIMLGAAVIEYFKTMADEQIVNQVRHVGSGELASYKIE